MTLLVEDIFVSFGIAISCINLGVKISLDPWKLHYTQMRKEGQIGENPIKMGEEE